MKAYNLPDLLTVLLTDENSTFKNKLISIGNGRFNDAVHRTSRYQTTDNVPIRREQIAEIMDNLYMVESCSDPEKCYSVDIKNNYCECKMGQLHGPCKHKQSIRKMFIKSAKNFTYYSRVN